MSLIHIDTVIDEYFKSSSKATIKGFLYSHIDFVLENSTKDTFDAIWEPRLFDRAKRFGLKLRKPRTVITYDTLSAMAIKNLRSKEDQSKQSRSHLSLSSPLSTSFSKHERSSSASLCSPSSLKKTSENASSSRSQSDTHLKKQLNASWSPSSSSSPQSLIRSLSERSELSQDGLSSSGTKRSWSTSSKDDSAEMTEAMKEDYKASYESMDNEDKWSLDDGVYVEDLMYEYGSKCLYEHLVHSWILDVNDPCWESIFTKQQLETIKTKSSNSLPSLNDDINETFTELANVLEKAYDKKELSSSPESPMTQQEEDEIIDAMFEIITKEGIVSPREEEDRKDSYLDVYAKKTSIY